MTYDDYKQMRTELRGYVENQLGIVSAVGYDEAAKGEEPPSKKLQDENERLTNDNLCVLVMGRFKSGKSTFLNALLGQNFLGTAAVPKTAVIAEISYSEQEDITLYPKKGKWKDGDQPFKIKQAELDNYTSIDHSAGEDWETPFDKVVIKYPLDICKNGITIVDSPGLDDPAANDRVTKEYYPKTDSIIYCMHSGMAYGNLDANEIDTLRATGYKSIIFVITNWDRIVQNDIIMGTNGAKDLSEYLTAKLSPLTELGKEGIFFVSSLDAFVGKKNHDANKLQSSGFPELETKLEKILADQKGRMKLVRSLTTVRTINRNLGYYLNDQVTVLKQDAQQLANKLATAQQSLSNAKQKADLISQQIELGIQSISERAKDKTCLFMPALIEKIPNWVKECKSEQKLGIRSKRKDIEKFISDILLQVKSKMTKEVEEWGKNTLVDDVISPRLTNLLLQQQINIDQCKRDIEQFSTNLNLDHGDVQEDNNQFVSILLAEITTALGLFIASMFTPIGWVAAIVAAVVSAVFAFISEGISIEGRAKKKITTELVNCLNNNKDNFAEKVKSEVYKHLSNVRTKLSDQLNRPVNQAQAIVNAAQEAIANNAYKEETIQKFNKNIPLNKKLGDKLENFFRQNFL